jgi:aspartate carbamoyltransferase catalytic subunit
MIYMEPVVQADYTQSRVERDQSLGATADNYKVTRDLMRKAKSDCMVFHSLPRMDELSEDVDSTRHALYWTEAFNAVVTKMALLALVLGAVE